MTRFPNDLCDALIADYPRLDILGVDAHAEQQSLERSGTWMHHRTPPSHRVWKDFVAYHASPAFFDECVRVFGDHVVRLYPARIPRASMRCARSRLGVRDRDPVDGCDFFLDAQISGNTPGAEAIVRQIDSRRLRTQTVFRACCTLRTPDDDSIGGDLDVLRLRPT